MLEVKLLDGSIYLNDQFTNQFKYFSLHEDLDEIVIPFYFRDVVILEGYVLKKVINDADVHYDQIIDLIRYLIPKEDLSMILLKKLRLEFFLRWYPKLDTSIVQDFQMVSEKIYLLKCYSNLLVVSNYKIKDIFMIRILSPVIGNTFIDANPLICFRYAMLDQNFFLTWITKFRDILLSHITHKEIKDLIPVSHLGKFLRLYFDKATEKEIERYPFEDPMIFFVLLQKKTFFIKLLFKLPDDHGLILKNSKGKFLMYYILLYKTRRCPKVFSMIESQVNNTQLKQIIKFLNKNNDFSRGSQSS